MGLRTFIERAFSSALNIATSAGAKAVTGPVKDISGTAKDVVDIRKAIVETKLAQFKVEEQESQIQKASLEDVMKYDPTTGRVIERARAAAPLPCGMPPPAGGWLSKLAKWAILGAVGLLLLDFLLWLLTWIAGSR